VLNSCTSIRQVEDQSHFSRYGPLKVVRAARAPIQRNRKKDLAPETRPQEIRHKEGEESAKDDTVTIVAAVRIGIHLTCSFSA